MEDIWKARSSRNMRFWARDAVVEAILVGEIENLAIAVYWLLRCPAPPLGGARLRVPNEGGAWHG